MKKNNFKSFLLLVFLFVGILTMNAQQSDINKKRSFGEFLMETPWRVGFGGSIIKDNNGSFESDIEFFNYTYYPARFYAEKDLRLEALSMQLVFESTSFKPHGFGTADINFKYNISSLLGKSKSFDAYGLLGCGVTYRDNKETYDVTQTTIYDDDIQPSLNAALGANLWLTNLMGINFEGQAKFATDPYLQANIGLVFKINPILKKAKIKPKSQEAKDALQHLRGIINK